MHNSEGIPKPATDISSSETGSINNNEGTLHPAALEMTEAFSAEQHYAQEALMLGQHFQKCSYNKGRLALEFNKGDLVLLNPHLLSLLRNETGCGKKLLMKYDGPFEIIQKLSMVSYRL
jgi:hypothetical protein